MWRATVSLFRHLLPREPFPLVEAALLLGEIEGPVDARVAHERLDLLAASLAARTEIASGGDLRARLLALVQALYGAEGFHGNRVDYHDPHNSFLHRVLSRRTGIPITLYLVVHELAARLDIPTFGISFPGHFLLGCEVAPQSLLVIDPFVGAALDRAGVASLHLRTTGRPPPDDWKALLAPAPPREILARMLRNLARSYEGKSGVHLERARELLGALEGGKGAPAQRPALVLH